METKDILLGAAIIAVGVIIYRSMRPPMPQPAPTTTGTSWQTIVGGAVGSVAAVGVDRFGEALRGEREWW